MDQKLNVALIQAYQVLEFTPEEIEKTFEDLSGIQQIAISSQLLQKMDQNEIDALNGIEQKSGEEKVALLKQIAEKYQNDPDFAAKAQAAAKKVVDEHIAYLKTRGDDGQKSRIAQILAEAE